MGDNNKIVRRIIELCDRLLEPDVQQVAEKLERIVKLTQSENEEVRKVANYELNKLMRDFSIIAQNLDNLADFIEQRSK